MSLLSRLGRCAVALLATCAASLAQADPLPLLRVTDLAELSGQWDARVVDLNNAGEVLMFSILGPALLWRPGVGLITVAEHSSEAHPMALNDRSQVAGRLTTRGGADHLPFVWDEAHGVQKVRLAGALADGLAQAINVHGRIAGSAQATPEHEHAIVGSVAGRARDPRPQQRGNSKAWAINAAGHLAGSTAAAPGCCTTAAFMDARGHVTLMGSLAPPGGRDRGVAYAINDADQAVGSSTSAHNADHAFLWSPSTGMVDLGLSPGELDWSIATGINASGQVVGSHGGPSFQGSFYWDLEHGAIDLNARLDPTDPLTARTVIIDGHPKINDLGQIVAYATIDGVYTPVLLSPVTSTQSGIRGGMER